MTEPTEIAEGSVWKERDSRFQRYVKVLSVDPSWVRIASTTGRRATRVRHEGFLKRFTPAPGVRL